MLGALTEILNKIYPKSNMSFPSFSLKYSTQKCRGLVCHFVPLNQGFRGSNGKASTESESVEDQAYNLQEISSWGFHFGSVEANIYAENLLFFSCELSAMELRSILFC